MRFTPSKLNSFLFFKLPSAFLSGVRVKHISPQNCTVAVRHRWINQNPFGSMYFAVQAMAAELSTGALVMLHIKNSGHNISMLVTGNRSSFTKKARGLITFNCADGALVEQAILKAISSGEGQSITMMATGTDEKRDVVSEFYFEWSIKVK